MLQHKSSVEAGLFEYRRAKIIISFPIDINIPSQAILESLLKGGTLAFPGGILDEEHPAIGEQLGIKRTWIVEDLGSKDEEVLLLCDQAWARISQVVSAAHKFAGAEFPAIEEKHDIETVRVLLRTDLDPLLAQKWGWK